MDLLFTHFGISGPAALRCSSFVNKELEKTGEPVTLLWIVSYTNQTRAYSYIDRKSKATKRTWSMLGMVYCLSDC